MQTIFSTPAGRERPRLASPLGIAFQFPEHATYQPSMHWKVRILDVIACMLGVRIKIDGVPYGTDRAFRSA
ncbi:hypothetical protein [Azospirillum soli]|uniref:hypothetical protein n=1 Tax=Azospirillum soli TaxID=1304799 RepID=UPI001AE560C2|nr:hypothetical protein [Azospirillum soli]MBP2311871.1 hypothetical protein [Azospirillum soli]